MNYKVLNHINRPQDLKLLGRVQLDRLCREIRHFLIDSVARTGGHLASNLGIVELTVALHKVFDSPTDQIVWDVGHQCYPHKILTGRRQLMRALRQKGGISGFTKTAESVHDAFIAGHASTSISVADGLSKARQVTGEPGHVIAVIGDGAFTGGLTFEGLHNAARRAKNLIVILNDNHMSISKSKGPLPRYLSKLRANKAYFYLKDLTKSALGAVPLVGDGLVEIVSNSKAQLKNALYNTTFFEELGYIHMGPVDGHNLGVLCDVLARAKTLDKPVFIHVETRKGKGYPPAERNPGAYHSVAPFNPARPVAQKPSDNSYSAVFGRHLAALGARDKRICAITAAMKYATGLNFFADRFKAEGRFFDVGIAEQHGAVFSAALASKGLIPVYAVYSSFLQRAYDQLIHDCSLEKRHIVLAVDRAGLVGEDGETHHGLFDCAFLSSIPDTVIYSPLSYRELRLCLNRAIYREDGVCAVRYPRGAQPEITQDYTDLCTTYTLYHDKEERDLLLITYGRVYAEVARAAEKLHGSGVAADVMRLVRVWPFELQALAQAAQYKRILFVEEGMRTGGIAEHFFMELSKMGFAGKYAVQAVTGFVPQGTVRQQVELLGLDMSGILQSIYEQLTERDSIHVEKKTR